jgi:hypothetical protein
VTRIVITGGPRTGKTTLASTLWVDLAIETGMAQDSGARLVRHTDDLIDQCKHLGKEAWSEASRITSTWLDAPGPWICEGVAMSRALRKWRDSNSGGPPPVDRVIYMIKPHEPLSAGQETMSKGVRTVHDGIEPWLREHGIVTEYR